MKKLPEHYIKMLHFLMDQWVNRELAEYDLTSAQSHIVGYLTYHEGPPCARDLERFFGLSHPTVSGLLSRLEKKGFIEFRPDAVDRRCKRIYVLPKGQQCHELMHQTIQKNEQRMTEGFTEEERAVFTDLLERAIRNMGGDPTPRRLKEEETQ